AVDRVVAAVGEIVTRRFAELEREVAIRQTEGQPAELDVDDLPYVLAVERVKDDDVVDAVQELRTEVLPERRQHLVADGLVRAACRGDGLAAEVGGHDDDGVLEVDRSTLAVGEPAVVEQLEQHVEHVVVRLLDLVEQQHAVRTPANGLGELATLLVADVSGRRADQPRHGVLLHVLGHVDADHGLLAVEQELRQGAGELGLSHAGGSEEDERADRPVGVLDAGARADDRAGHRLDGLVLADDALVQLVGEMDELLALALDQLGDWDAGPTRHDLRDVLLVDLLLEQALLALRIVRLRLLGPESALELGELAVLQLGGLVQVVLSLGLLDRLLGLLDLLLEIPQRSDAALLGFPLR